MDMLVKWDHRGIVSVYQMFMEVLAFKLYHLKIFDLRHLLLN